jgi:hypothetical protein
MYGFIPVDGGKYADAMIIVKESSCSEIDVVCFVQTFLR